VAREQVLVVEDNATSMKLFRDVLLATGYRPLEATTGSRAVELAAERGPALVLMDIQLPDLDGISALGRLRADERTASIPVLALTAQAMQGDRERLLAAGFDGYVAKPVDVGELLDTVRRHCDGAATRDSGDGFAMPLVAEHHHLPRGLAGSQPVERALEVVEWQPAVDEPVDG
jgi:two-component system cell cycle response regulator DivK